MLLKTQYHQYFNTVLPNMH